MASFVDENNNLLLDCSRYGELEDIISLLQAGADVNFSDVRGNTSLHFG